MNSQWHEDNPVPIYPKSAVLGWHLRHEAVCSCRPTPEAVLRDLDQLGIITPGRVDRMPVPRESLHGPGIHPQFPHVLIVNGPVR